MKKYIYYNEHMRCRIKTCRDYDYQLNIQEKGFIGIWYTVSDPLYLVQYPGDTLDVFEIASQMIDDYRKGSKIENIKRMLR